MKTTFRLIRVKLQKTKDKEKNIKSSYQNHQILYPGKQTIKITAKFSSETMEARKQKNDI